MLSPRQLSLFVMVVALVFGIVTGFVFKDLFGLPWSVGFAIGPAIVFGLVLLLVARVLIRIRLLRSEARDLALARKSAEVAGRVIRRDDLTVWQAGPKDLSGIVFDEWDEAKARFAAMTGAPANVERAMRVFLFADRRGFLQYGRGIGVQVPGILDGFFLAALPVRIIAEMPNPVKRLSQPEFFLRSLFGPGLLYGFKGFLVNPWLSIGVGGLIGRNSSAGEQARLNRKVLPGVLGHQHILDARELFRLKRSTVFCTLRNRPGEKEHADSTRAMHQCHSLLDYLAGRDAPSIRVEPFRAFLKDLKRRDNYDAVFLRHFSYGLDQLHNNWSEWVRARGVGTHESPPRTIRTALLDHVIPLIADRRALPEDRVQAIRDMGQAGYTLGADSLIDLLNDRDWEMRATAVWALEAISGTAGGEDIAHWEAWWDGLPREVEPAAGDDHGPPADPRK